jgi:predicted transcriptional regulator
MNRQAEASIDGELPRLSKRNSQPNSVGPMKTTMKNSDLCEHRRGRYDVIMSILAAAQKGAIKTKIIENANLSTAQADAYLTELESHNFLSKDTIQGKKSFVWKTTNAGLTLIEACQVCHLLADKFT